MVHESCRLSTILVSKGMGSCQRLSRPLPLVAFGVWTPASLFYPDSDFVYQSINKDMMHHIQEEMSCVTI